MTEHKTLPRQIYTDGAAPNNQTVCTQGGIGVAVYSNSGELEDTFSSPVYPTEAQAVTNVRCEMLAVIKTLELAEPDDIIHTDNEMIVKGYNEWLEGWKKKGWKTASKKPVANQDLWNCIDALKQEKPQVVIKWVQGHSGIAGNELADNLATEAAA